MTGPGVDEGQQDAAEDLLDEAVALALFLDWVSSRHTDWIRAKLLDLRGDILALVARIEPTEPVRLSYRLQRLERLIAEAQEAISEAFAEIERRTAAVLTAVAETSQTSLSEIIALLLLIKGLSKLRTRAELGVLAEETLVAGATAQTWAARQSGDMQFRLARALREAMSAQDVRPATLDALVSAIRGPDIGPGGLFKAPLRDVENLALTAVHAVANRIRVDTVRTHPELFSQFIHISVIDQVTSDLCRPRHMLRWDLDGKPIGHALPFRIAPLHFRCRSHVVPVLHAHADLPERLRKRTSPKDFTGKPAADVGSLDDWLRKMGGEVDHAKLLRIYRKALDDLTSGAD